MIRRLVLLLGLVLAPGLAHATCPVIPFVFPANSINPLQVNTNFTSVRDCIVNASSFVQVNSSTALRALTAGVEPIVYRGYNLNPGDGTGLYYWSPSSTCTDDGISCIKPASNPATGRWLNGVLIASGLGGATIGGNVTNVISVGRPGISATTGVGFSKTVPTATDGSSVLVTRNATYTGGTPGFVNAGLQAACHSGAGILTSEQCFLVQMDNAGTVGDASQNSAIYSQAVKQSTGATWAAALEIIDVNISDASTAAPVGLEVAMQANDADPAGNRTLLALLGKKRTGGSGVTPVIGAAIQIGDGTAADASYTRGVWYRTATYDVGDDFRDGTYGSAPIWFPDDAAIIFDTAGTAKQYWESGSSSIVMTTGANLVRQQFFNTGEVKFTDGTVGMILNPLTASTAGILATNTAHDLVLQRNSAEKLRLITTGVNVTGDLATAGKITATDGTVAMLLNPLTASSAGIVATTSNHDLVLQAHSAEFLRGPAAGGLMLSGLAVVAAGTGKRFVCIDTATKIVYEGSGASCN